MEVWAGKSLKSLAPRVNARLALPGGKRLLDPQSDYLGEATLALSREVTTGIMPRKSTFRNKITLGFLLSCRLYMPCASCDSENRVYIKDVRSNPNEAGLPKPAGAFRGANQPEPAARARESSRETPIAGQLES